MVVSKIGRKLEEGEALVCKELFRGGGRSVDRSTGHVSSSLRDGSTIHIRTQNVSGRPIIFRTQNVTGRPVIFDVDKCMVDVRFATVGNLDLRTQTRLNSCVTSLDQICYLQHSPPRPPKVSGRPITSRL